MIKNQHLKSLINLIHNGNYSFCKYHIINKFNNLYYESKYFCLIDSQYLDKFSGLEPQKGESKEKKTNVYEKASELYDQVEIHFDEYYDLSNARESKMDPKHDPANLTLDA